MPLEDTFDKNLSVLPDEKLLLYGKEDGQMEVPRMKESYMLGLDSLDKLDISMQRDSVLAMGIQAMQDKADDIGIEYDTSFNDEAKNEYWDTYLQDTIHEDFKDSMLSRARSVEHIQDMYDSYYMDSAQLRYMEEQGMMTQFGYAILAEATNLPLYFGAAFALPALTSVAGASFASRMITGVPIEMGLEGIKELVGRQDKDALDYLGAGILGGGLGAMFGKNGIPMMEIANKHILKISGITDEVIKKVSKATTKADKEEIVAKAYQAKTNREADQTMLDILDENIKTAKMNPIQKGHQALRQDLAYMAGQSKSPTVSAISKQMFPDPALQDLTLDNPALESLRNVVESSMRSKRQGSFEGLLHRFSGNRFLKAGVSVQDKFSDLVGTIQLDRRINGTSLEKAVKNTMAKKGYDDVADKETFEILMEAGEKAGKLADDYHDTLGDFGHKDFKLSEDGKSTIPKDKSGSFMPFIFDKGKSANLMNRGVKSSDLIRLFKNAMKSKNPKMDDETLDKVAITFYHASTASKLESAATFKGILEETLADPTLIPSERDMILSLMQPVKGASEEAGGTSARLRTNIDYAYKESVILSDGSKIEIGFEDILSSDYTKNMDGYARKMAGTTALQKIEIEDIVQPLSKKAIEEDALKSPEAKKILSAKAEKEAFDADVNRLQSDILKVLEKELTPEQLDNSLKIIESELKNFVPESKNTFEYTDKFGELKNINKKEYAKLGIIARKTQKGKELTKEEGVIVSKRADYFDENIDALLTSKKDDFEPNVIAENQLGIKKKTLQEAKLFLNGDEKYRGSFDEAIEAVKDRFISYGATELDAIKEIPFIRDSVEPIRKAIDDILEKVKVLSGTDFDKQLDDLVNKRLINEGIRKTSSRQSAFDLSQALKTRGLDAKKKAVNDILDRLKKENPKNVDELLDLAKQINARFKKAGKVSHEEAKEIFSKKYPNKKLDVKSDAYKEIHKAVKKKSTVNLDDFEKRFKEMDFREPTINKISMNTPADYQKLREKIVREYQEAVDKGEMKSKELSKEMVRWDTIMNDFRGISTSKDPAGKLNRLYRIMHSYNVGRLLNQTFFTMPAEMMNVMTDSGVRNMIETMPMMKALIKQYRTGVVDNLQLKELNESLGLFDEFLSGAKLFEFDHELASMTTKQGKKSFIDKVEAFGQSFSEFTLMIGGIKPLTAWFQASHAMGVFKQMSKVANGGKKSIKYNKMIKELGLSDEMAEAVYANIKTYSKDGLMNFNKWDNEVKNVFLVGVKQRSDTLVQMQRLGDKMGWVSEEDFMFKDTFIGKTTMELKQFVMTAYTKQLGRAINRADMYMVGLMSAQLMSLTLAYIAKQGLNYAGNQEKLNEALTPERIAGGVIGMMPQGSLAPQLAGLASSALTGKNIFGSRHSGGATDLVNQLPFMDLINKGFSTMTVPYNIGKDGFQLKDLRAPAGITGISNSPFIKPFWEAGIADDGSTERRLNY